MFAALSTDGDFIGCRRNIKWKINKVHKKYPHLHRNDTHMTHSEVSTCMNAIIRSQQISFVFTWWCERKYCKTRKKTHKLFLFEEKYIFYLFRFTQGLNFDLLSVH
jgi:hypothetical protein